MCAAEHARPSYRSSYEYCRVFLVIMHTRSRMVPTAKVPGTSTAQPHQRIPYLNIPGTCYLSCILSCVGIRRVIVAACDVLTDTGTA